VKSPRDVYILLFLGFFLLLAGFLFDQSPLMTIYQFIPVIAILNGLTSIHIIKFNSTEIDFSEDEKIKSEEWNLFNHPFLITLKKLSKYLVLALPLMIVLFVFFPRLSGPIWKMPGGSNNTSGISDSMTPGDVSLLHLSQEVAFRVRFKSNTPPEHEMYWRVLVLDEYDGLTWSRHDKDQGSISTKALDAIKNEVLNTNKQQNIYYEYDISLEETNQKWLTFLDRPISIPKRSKMFLDYSVKVPYRLVDRVRYTAESILNLKLDSVLSQNEKLLNTYLPDEFNKKSFDWAVTQRKLFSNDREYIHSILKTIHQQEFFYTLRPPIMKQDTVDDFWFEQRRGFCEHYAGSLVFLARAANIPARVVIGYQGAEKNPLSDYWIVRHANAHAWTEIWFEDEGWIRIDPTAAIAQHRIEEALQADYRQRNSLFDNFGFDSVDLNDIGWVKNIQYWADQVNTSWNDWVIDYNQGQQKKLFNGLGFEHLTSQQISFIMIALLAIFLSLIGRKWFKPVQFSDPVQRSFHLLLSKLEKKGMKIDGALGAYELLMLIENKNGHQADINIQPNIGLQKTSCLAVIRVLKRYIFLRYKKQHITVLQEKAFHRQVKTLIIRTNTDKP